MRTKQEARDLRGARAPQGALLMSRVRVPEYEAISGVLLARCMKPWGMLQHPDASTSLGLRPHIRLRRDEKIRGRVVPKSTPIHSDQQLAVATRAVPPPAS